MTLRKYSKMVVVFEFNIFIPWNHYIQSLIDFWLLILLGKTLIDTRKFLRKLITYISSKRSFSDTLFLSEPLTNATEIGCENICGQPMIIKFPHISLDSFPASWTENIYDNNRKFNRVSSHPRKSVFLQLDASISSSPL